MAEAKLYVIPGSHPSRTARRMLEIKGIPYKRVDLIPVVSKAVLRAVGFSGDTVPALKLDGAKVQGSREIARALDQIQPDPPLFPADATSRSSVEAAERWGDEDLQQKARRILWWSLKRNRAPMASYSQGAKLGVPVGQGFLFAPGLSADEFARRIGAPGPHAAPAGRPTGAVT